MRKRAGAGFGAGVLVLSALLAGCGGDDGNADDGDNGGSEESSEMSAEEFSQLEWEELRKIVEEDMASLESVRVNMSIQESGSDIQADIAMSTTGSCEGTLTVDGANVELLQAGGETWFKAEPAFWENNVPEGADQIIAAVGDKWVVDPGEYQQFCDLEAFLDNIVSDDDQSSGHEISEPQDVDGEQVVQIDYENEGDPVTALVRAEGEHYIVEIDRNGDDESGTVAFSEYDEEIQTEAPAEDEIVNLDELG